MTFASKPTALLDLPCDGCRRPGEAPLRDEQEERRRGLEMPMEIVAKLLLGLGHAIEIRADVEIGGRGGKSVSWAGTAEDRQEGKLGGPLETLPQLERLGRVFMPVAQEHRLRHASQFHPWRRGLQRLRILTTPAPPRDGASRTRRRK